MPDHSSTDSGDMDAQQSNQHPDGERSTGTIGSHPSVLAIPGSPPWFSCQECGAYRSTHAGLEDLPCEPDRYDDIDPAERISAGEVVHARIDQVLEHEDSGQTVLAHAVETGVRIGLETKCRDIARGDEIAVRITDISNGTEGQFEQVISRRDRVNSPTIVPRDDGGESQ